jgi:ubiquinone/menaquinone biosynthesis C-methylase UbiE
MANLPDFFEGTEMPTAGWWEALWPDPAAVLDTVGVMPGMNIVDLCSGDGWFTLQTVKRARHVMAIDIDRQLLDVTRHRLAESGVSNCDFVEGNAYELASLVRHPVDLVFLANAFHGVPDRSRLCLAVKDILAPGGRFAVVNWHQRPREETTILGEPRGPRTELRLSPEQTIEAVESASLKFLKRADVPPYHYAAIFEQPAAKEPR